MRADLTSTILELRLGAILSLSLAPGWCVLCISGALWVTEAGVRTDHVLEAGQVLQLASRGKILIEALHEGRLQLIAPKSAEARLPSQPIGPPRLMVAA